LVGSVPKEGAEGREKVGITMTRSFGEWEDMEKVKK